MSLSYYIWILGSFSNPIYTWSQILLTIMNDFSRYTWVFMLTTKGATPEQIKFFVAYVETQFNGKIKTIRTYNGTEFSLPNFYKSKGIIHQTNYIGKRPNRMVE